MLVKQAIIASCLLSNLAFASLDKGQKLYRQEKFAEAANEFFLESKKKKSSSAEWWLAKSLRSLELYYSSSKYLSRLISKEQKGDQGIFKNAIVELSEINGVSDLGQTQILALFNKDLKSNYIPQEGSNFYYFYRGVEYFSNQRYQEAEAQFRKVGSGTAYYAKSIFNLGIIAAIGNRSEEAIEYFQKIQDISGSRRNKEWLIEQANLNIARTYYQMGNFVKSIEYYSKIPRNSDNWLRAIFEAAWAFLLIDKPNSTLGNLLTINSPFFENRFFPESYILEAITYLRMCRYDKVKEAMANFKTRYSYVLKDISQVINDSKRNSKLLFRIVYDYREQNLDKYRNAFSIIDALSRTDTYKQAIASIKNSDEELESLERHASLWKRSGLYSEIKKFLIHKKYTDLSVAGKKLFEQAQNYHGYLYMQSEQTKLITAEMLFGKIDSLKQELDIKTTQKTQSFVGMQPLKIGQELEYWPFEGEYWEDELGSYVFNIESSCTKNN